MREREDLSGEARVLGRRERWVGDRGLRGVFGREGASGRVEDGCGVV